VKWVEEWSEIYTYRLKEKKEDQKNGLDLYEFDPKKNKQQG